MRKFNRMHGEQTSLNHNSNFTHSSTLADRSIFSSRRICCSQDTIANYDVPSHGSLYHTNYVNYSTWNGATVYHFAFTFLRFCCCCFTIRFFLHSFVLLLFSINHSFHSIRWKWPNAAQSSVYIVSVSNIHVNTEIVCERVCLSAALFSIRLPLLWTNNDTSS